jgi:hypothetical protein
MILFSGVIFRWVVSITSMRNGTHYRKRVEDVRCPDINGLSDEHVHMLHRSYVDILGMRRSIETADLHASESRKALRGGMICWRDLRPTDFSRRASAIAYSQYKLCHLEGLIITLSCRGWPEGNLWRRGC